MNSKEYVSDQLISAYLDRKGFTGTCADEGRLILMELLAKAGAGYMNSHTEEGYLNSFDLMQKNRLPNKKGRRFLCSMVYASSNKRSEVHGLIERFRRAL